MAAMRHLGFLKTGIFKAGYSTESQHYYLFTMPNGSTD